MPLIYVYKDNRLIGHSYMAPIKRMIDGDMRIVIPHVKLTDDNLRGSIGIHSTHRVDAVVDRIEGDLINDYTP